MIGIRTFRSADAAVLPRKDDLFSQSLLDFAMGFEAPMREYIRHSLADDLADISASYFNEPGGHFWVADVGGQIKGMVGIQRRTREEAELRRRFDKLTTGMSVAASPSAEGLSGAGLPAHPPDYS